MAAACIDPVRQSAAKVAGFSYLLSFPLVVVAQFGIHDRLIIPGHAAETARNILAHTTLFRVGMACDLAYCAGTAIVAVYLFIVLRPVNSGLALIAAVWRLCYVVLWVLMTLDLFDALRLLSGDPYLGVFTADQLSALAKLQLSERFDRYYTGLLFAGLASTVCSWLWYRSNEVPRPLAVIGMLSSAFCALCTAIFIMFPGYAHIVDLVWFDSPMGIFDIALSFWLIIKGLKAPFERAESRI